MRKALLFLVLAITLFSGCAAVVGHKKTIDAYTANFINKNCDLTELEKKIQKDDDTILSANQAGSIAMQCGDHNASIYYFDIAESRYKDDVDEKSTLSKVGAETGSMLVNENVLDYEGYYYERVMTNLYKSINFMSQNNMEFARVELNRAIDRQRMAKDRYAKDLEKAKEELAQKEVQDKNNQTIAEANKKSNEAQIENILSSYQNSIGDFKVLPNFINPFTTYLAGIFFFAERDYEKSRDLLKETLLMDEHNPQVQKDMLLADQFLSSTDNRKKPKYAWIIYENGQTLSRKERRFDIPFFIATTKIPHLGIALPTLDQSSSSYANLVVNNDPTVVISDMDAVVKTEFKDQMPLRVTRVITRAVAKAALGYAANETFGNIGSLVTGIYGAMTNVSDTRYWSSLPQNFQSLRVENNGQDLEIFGDDETLIQKLTLQKDQNAIIYIRSIARGSYTAHEIYFKGE